MKPIKNKFSLALYVVFGIVFIWMFFSFLFGTIRGVYSTEGKDLLAAHESAIYLCGAAAILDQPIIIPECPSKPPCGSVKKLIASARASADKVTDAALKDKLIDTLNSFEVVASGKLSFSQASRLITGPMSEFLK